MQGMLALWTMAAMAHGSHGAKRPQLLMAHVVWRHGDRSPVAPLPSEVAEMLTGHNRWPNGFGELTAKGMEQQFELGQRLGQRYKGLLEDFAMSEVYVRSDDWNRTLISAYANMAGMWEEGAVKGETIPANRDWPSHWLPVPVHTIDLDNDNVIWTGGHCPAAEEYERNVVDKLPSVTSYLASGKAFLDHVYEAAKYPKLIPPRLMIDHLADALLCEKSHPERGPMPAWALESSEPYGGLAGQTVYDTLEDMNGYLHSYDFYGKLGRLRGGNLLREVVERMRLKVDCREQPLSLSCPWVNGLRLYAYSAHDSTINAVMSALGATDVMPHGQPGFAGALLIELWLLDDGRQEVRTFYKDSFQDPDFHQFQVGGCPSRSCSLEKFETRSEPMMPVDWAAECGLTQQQSSGSSSAASGSSGDPGFVWGLAAGSVVVATLATVLFVATRPKRFTSMTKDSVTGYATF